MRAVLMSEDAKLAAHYTQIARAHEGHLLRASSPGAVLEAIARGLRLGNPLHTVLVDSALASAATASTSVTSWPCTRCRRTCR